MVKYQLNGRSNTKLVGSELNEKNCEQCQRSYSLKQLFHLCTWPFKKRRGRNYHHPYLNTCWVYCMLLWLLDMPCKGQTVGDFRPFPSPQNIAKKRPIFTIPSDSTCGLPDRNAYCLSSNLASSVEQCVQGFCQMACAPNGRTELPNYENLLIARSSGFTQCVESDTINVRPGSRVTDYATSFTAPGDVCFLSSALDPQPTVNSSFTIVAWIWIDQDIPGVLLEKTTTSGSKILQVSVGPKGVNVTFASQTGQKMASLVQTIGQQNWTHLAIQVYGKSMSFFINGLENDYKATSTMFLEDMISNSSGSFRLGQSADGTGQFLGKMQDVRYYSTTLSNREIQEVYSGTLPPVRIQNNCRCPPFAPRIKPQDIRFCLSNGVPDNAGDATLRISEFSHPVEYANDEDVNTFWISKFQNEVTLEVDLGDLFEVFHVTLEFYSPLPKAITIERFYADVDGYQPWQYYAENCTFYFGMESNETLAAADAINCIELEANKISLPYTKGNIMFTVVATNRPGFTDYYNNPTMQQFVQASRVRVRLQDHLYVKNIRHEYFALYEFRVSGRCGCNGHAETCSVEEFPYKCLCTEESHTEGDRCDRCQPSYNNKPFRQGSLREAYDCQFCECYNHSDSCIYNSTLDPFPSSWTEGGGGVCVNCRDNTEGQNCEICVDGYFRPFGKGLSEPDVCTLCLCNSSGTLNDQAMCEKEGGQCPCKANVTGRACDQCTVGSYNLQAINVDGCAPCDCNIAGTINGSPACNQVTGICFCKQNVRGKQCTDCEYGFFNLTEENPSGCSACVCNPMGSESSFCNPATGQCTCKSRIQGIKCDQCMDGYYNFSAGCLPCDCNATGTEPSTSCDRDTGQCVCKSLTIGRQCNACKLGSNGFGNSLESGCEQCYCVGAGVPAGQIDCSKGCTCKANVMGPFCQQCKPNFFNLSRENVLGCEPCDCDASGVNNMSSCNTATGVCVCLPNRIGRRCDDCSTGYFKNTVEGGCLECNCDPNGKMPGTTCNSQTGNCSCRNSDGVSGANCDQCSSGYHNFQTGRCTLCNCLEAGSLGTDCNKKTGECACKQFVTGLQCDRCVEGASNLNQQNPYGCSKIPSQQPAPVYTPLSPTSINISWSPPDFPNGDIQQYRLFRNDLLIYQDKNRYHVDTDLQPYTLYAYRVEAVNSLGSVSSPSVTFRTNPGIPSADMTLQVMEIQMASAHLSWNAPSILNGPLLKYQLVSHNSQNQTISNVEWEGINTTAVLTLRPYQSYNLTVRACTGGGCSESKGVTFITKTAAPTDMPPPIITALSNTTLLVEWQPPHYPNGIISFYELWMRGLPDPTGQRDPIENRIFYSSGQYDPLNSDQSIMAAPATSFNVTELKPFTVYEFLVLAENEAGRASSPWTAGRTLETSPAFLSAPVVVGISSSELQISWSVPTADEARGNITLYKLYQNMPTNLTADPFASPMHWQSMQVINETDGATYSIRVLNLLPYKRYEFMLEACNSMGCINSTVSSGTTLPAAPVGMKKPLVDSYNSTVMQVIWQPPAFPNGPTLTYTVQKTSIALSSPASVVRGTRFPGGGFYAFPPESLPQNVDFTGVRFEFRLQQDTGLLMFAASENHQEYIAILFSSGRPRFIFDTQGDCETLVEVNDTSPENVNLTSLADRQVHRVQVLRRNGNDGSILVDEIYSGCANFPGVSTFNDEGLIYSDNKWHSFKAQRYNGIYANVTIDYKWTGTGSIRDVNCESSSIIGHSTNVFVGGVPPEFVLRRNERSILQTVMHQSFQGCIQKVEVLKQVQPYEVWEELNWASAVSYDLAFLNWQGCPINLDQGIHFMGKGYVAVPNCESSSCLLRGNAAEIKISFQMRTSLHTGLLFIAHGGSGIYMMAYMQNESLVFEFSNNGSKVQVQYTESNPTKALCDAEWHSLEFTKVKGQGGISVDSGPRFVSGDPAVDKIVPVISPIYLGGVKPNSEVARFIASNGISSPSEGFGGCLKDLMIDNTPLHLSLLRDLVNVNLDGCPPFHIPEDTCESNLVSDIYSGSDYTAYDYDLLPYTDYIYQVVAKNSQGETSSPWGYGRTREGVPVGVGPPTAVRALSGYDVEVEWDEPQSTSGLLIKTTVLAYSLDQPDQPPITEDIFDDSVKAINMTGLTPSTNYRIKIAACTSSGCTESSEGADVLTFVEVPEGVVAPKAIATAHTLLVSWDPPEKPNGNITGYFLFMEGTQKYAGGERQFLVTQLLVYTSYQFFVQACTVAGCSSGPVAVLSTAQLPPTEVKTPVLTVLGARSIEVKWEEPEELNGVLERYLVYLSIQEGNIGRVVHNTTVFFPGHVISNLTAGTHYYIAVGACTGGGCTVSNASDATTAENSPEGIAEPVVISPSPTQLHVSWQEPQFPNGVIISYTLYHNDLSIAKGMLFSYELQGLQPYSRHVFRLEVCTAEGCGASSEVEARTQEAMPEGTVVLTASVVDARTVSASWTRPSQANGQLFFYVYFEGFFYVDTDSGNYSTVTDRRILLRDTISDTVVQISPLIPLANYGVQVNASNSRGFILSNVVRLTMPPGSPDGMRPPQVESDTPQSLIVTWQAVGNANAFEEVAYLVQFRKQEGDIIVDEFGPTTTLSYRKTDLRPFTSYQFRMQASNSYGSVLSPWVTATTQQDKSAGVHSPRIVVVESRSISLEWSAPDSPNGIIAAYRLYQNAQLRVELLGNVSSHVVEKLTPYQQYSFQLEACTAGGCTLSDPSSTVRTQQAVADGIAAPGLMVLTPAIIEIHWSEPSGPNGIISQYLIERRLAAGTDISIVGAFLPSDTKSFIDDSAELTPFTTYSYRIKVVNNAGTGVGPWANITTSSARPGGVASPVLTVINATSIGVTWLEPYQTNGIIEYYVLEWADDRKEIRNIAQRSDLLDNLVPYTEYSVTVSACTSQGCTKSAPASARTSAAVPSDQSPPTATAVSTSAVSVLWQPPAYPNGFNIHYELSRKKIRQPLISSPALIGVYQSVYSGAGLFYTDQNLTMFTTFVYRITTFNNIGQTVSEDSEEVTTYGGFPRRAPQISAAAVSHMEIMVNWTMPDPVDLQGEIQYLNLTAQSAESLIMENPPVGTDNFTLNDLSPNTDYTVQLAVTIFGGASVTSNPVIVSTHDGAPEGIPAPVLAVVSNTALRVTWIVPAKPNGNITAYNIIVNGKVVPTESTQPGSMILNDLQPYTVYSIQVEACTVFRCSRSNVTYGTTAEALPLGMSPPVLTPENASTVEIEWQMPSQPNGIILRYELWRKSMQSCSEISVPEVNPEHSKCTYLECGVFQNLCGMTCYSGDKACCDGVLYDRENGYDCCGTSYILRSSPEDVCCGVKFFQPQPDFSCCGTRYVKVLPGEVCCVSSVEDRVAVGQGDKCCGDVPFSSTGSQICCGGQLVGGYKRQCCGGDIVTDYSVCCGNATVGQIYLPQAGYVCCGQVYSANDTSLCCQSDTRHTKVHYYNSRLEKISANEVCCGLEKISAGLFCCNYVGYNSITQTCADRSDVISGCGTGVVCPVSQSNRARCNRCDFDSTTTVCGSVPGYLPAPTTPIPGDGSTCSSGEENIYSGLQLSYSDKALIPHSQYQYSVRAVNSAGITSSRYVEVQTSEAPPIGLEPPIARINPEQLNVIYLIWNLPRQPNGEIIHYILLRDGVEIFRGLNTVFTDDTNVLPYKIYTYMLTACTIAGCTNSPNVTIATAQGIPEDIPAPDVTVLSPTSIQVSIKVAGRPNGLLLGYTVLVRDREEKYTVTTPQNVLFEGLLPYTQYFVHVEVCTVVGCADSPTVSVTTAEATPQGVDPPKVMVLSASSVNAYWKMPMVLNGQLQAYRLILQDSAGELVVYRGINLTTTVHNLTPGRTYNFVLDVSTNAGSTRSQPSQIVMPVITPLNVPPPERAEVLSATEMSVSWKQVNSSEGVIDQYRVLLNFGKVTEIITGVNKELSVRMSGLKAYTVYEVRLQACLQGVSGGCGTSDPIYNRTFEAPPTGQAPPTLMALASNAVKIEWRGPTNPNGIITFFRIFQRSEGGTGNGILINQVDGSIFSFTHSGSDVKPYSLYQYGIMAGNSQGQTAVQFSSVRTLQAVPQGLSPPTVSATSAYSVILEWDPPSQPNGIISLYRIYFKYLTGESSTEEFVIVNGNLTDTVISGLLPYSQYQMRLTAENEAGTVSSTAVNVSTRQASPSGIQDFRVEKIATGNSVILRWDPPLRTNGIITIYRIYEMSDEENSVYAGLSRMFEFRRLQPYTEYTVKLEACTSEGCTFGKKQTFMTAEIAPTAQPIPTVGTVTSNSVVLNWTAPLNDNGRIMSYEVHRRTTPLRRKRQAAESETVEVIYYTNDTDAESYVYTDRGLRPYTRYEYKIRASNSQGFTDSPWQSVQTSQAAPEGVSPPALSYIDGYVNSINVSWLPPDNPNGVLQSYRIQRNSSSPLSFPPDGALYYVFERLLAYTWYSFTLTACSGGGCTTSKVALIRTKEAAPLLVSPPVLSPLNSAIRANWSVPQVSNGEITLYRLIVDMAVEYEGMEREYTVTGLIPYQEYSFILTACTHGGCTSSEVVIGRPDDSPPSDMDPPLLRVISSTAIEVSWSPPKKPNGFISSYDVRRNGVLIRTLNAIDDFSTVYTDSDLQPGEEYTYTVIARNRKGSVESPSSQARTYASSPTGLASPTLTPVSSNSIKATWTRPANPNGQIVNYTLYQGNELAFSGSAEQLTYTVPGLSFFTEYTFRIQACTQRGCVLSEPASSRTFEAQPQQLEAPNLFALASESGAHEAVQVTWREPLRPNGVILYYQLQRRIVAQNDNGDVILVYNGTDFEYIDTDPRILPFRQYQYMVIAFNSAGSVDSPWAEVTTKQAPPTFVEPPEIMDTSATTITVSITEPQDPRGVIRLYSVLVNGSVQASGLSQQLTAGEEIPLEPFTTYAVSAQVCTGGGCTNSSSVVIKTAPARPSGLQPLSVVDGNSTDIALAWEHPSKPNGDIIQFVVYKRSACPPTEQPFPQTCMLGATDQVFEGLENSTVIGGLSPYSAYEFMLQVENEIGIFDFPEWVRATTSSAAPLYVKTPTLSKNASLAVIDWTGSFVLNGRLTEYLLRADSFLMTRGISTVYSVQRTSKDGVITFEVQVVTDGGQVTSPPIIFDPNAVNNLGTTESPVTPVSQVMAKLWYEEVWFIIVIVIVILLIFFIIFALCLRRSGLKRPYVRERLPLPPEHDKLPRDLFVIDASDGSIIDARISPSALSGRNALYQGPGTEMLNPAFDPTLPHLNTLSLEHGSKSSTRGLDDDDIDDLTWDKHFDSGLFEDDDGESFDNPAYSYTKEQTVFTDTHL